MKKSVTILSVGKLKTPHWQAAAKEYINRLQRSWQLKLGTVREAAGLEPPRRISRESANLLAACPPGDYVIALDEAGETCTSAEFARRLAGCWEKDNQTPCFLIGGAYGLSEEARQKASRLLSLGPMTYPHELAQVLLLEQLYRAEAILRGAPYHHG